MTRNPTIAPYFAAEIHNRIYQKALVGMSHVQLKEVEFASLYIDVNVSAYDPRDHFDFSYIDESWVRVNKRLSTKSLWDFALAIHAIGDFYSHSYYGYFMLKAGHTEIPIYDPAKPIPPATLTYDFSGLGELKDCTIEREISKPEDLWKGRLISGQWSRWFAPIPSELGNSPDFARRKCLPDHDAVAVDKDAIVPEHKLFSKQEYKRQAIAREQAAIAHIGKVYIEWL